ncbi:hypothetical protein [Foetidibacter luteolus]|nr:hypothetical protein [Foetidibacter luteolus]
MKTIVKKLGDTYDTHQENFSKKRAITVGILLLGFVFTTFYLMVRCLDQ